VSTVEQATAHLAQAMNAIVLVEFVELLAHRMSNSVRLPEAIRSSVIAVLKAIDIYVSTVVVPAVVLDPPKPV
jgi:hypothetical protein